MVSGLMVESSCENIPEPTVSGIVLCGGYLHLSPASCEHELVAAVLLYHSPVHVDKVISIWFRPLYLTDHMRELEYDS